MPATILSDNGASSGTAGLKTSGSNDGILELQTTTGGGTATAAITIDTGQRSKFPTTIGVGGATPATSGSGISFPASASASSDANTLDDYEEGTFTPTVVYSGTNTPTVSGQTTGRYTKIGRVVSVQTWISWNENGSTGNITFGGLPFTSLNNIYTRAVPSFLSLGLTGLPTNMSITGNVTTNSTTVTPFLNDNAGTQLSATYTDNDQDVLFTVVYEVA